MIISPHDIDITNGLWSTEFNNCERETIAENIVFISRPFDKFVPFTWEEYKERCTHEVTDKEKHYLDLLVNESYLAFVFGKYYVTVNFVKAITDIPKHVGIEVEN